jgi:hypothetical protein
MVARKRGRNFSGRGDGCKGKVLHVSQFRIAVFDHHQPKLAPSLAQ